MVAVLQPVDTNKYIAIDRAVVLVGRSTDCDAVISSSKKISRRHCCLVQVNDDYYVRDLGSMNGVWLNGNRVNREAQISAGDKLSIGDVDYLFHPNARIEQRRTPPVPPRSSVELSGSALEEAPENTSASESDNTDLPIVDAVEVYDGDDEFDLIQEDNRDDDDYDDILIFDDE